MNFKSFIILFSFIVSGCSSSTRVPKGKVINVKNFGAIGNGIVDDTKAVQKALNEGGKIFFPAGIYSVKPVTYISNSEIFGHGDQSILQLRFDTPPVTSDIQSVLYAANIDTGPSYNVHIHDLVIDGNRNNIDWSNIRGDGNGNGITTWGTKNLEINNVLVKDCWTDGVFVCATRRTTEVHNTEDFRIHDLVINNCGRQGVSVISANDGRFDDIEIRNITRTSPRAGFDFEPNRKVESIYNIEVSNITIDSSGQGIAVSGYQNVHDLSFDNININDVMNQYSFIVTGAYGIEIKDLRVNNANGSSTYPTLAVKEAYDVTFSNFELRNCNGPAVIALQRKAGKVLTKAKFENFLIDGFDHSAIYQIRPIDEAIFKNGIIRKTKKTVSQYSIIVADSENMNLSNIEIIGSDAPYLISSKAQQLDLKNLKLDKRYKNPIKQATAQK